MKVYRLYTPSIEYYEVAKDLDEAYEKGKDPKRYPDLHFRPFKAEQIEVDGYVVTATPVDEGANEEPRRRGRRKL